ncbi:PAS domain-containing sensor histidine kinase [Ktedonobacter racemifer]|uniref:histidine kinase n=1 Tax=Ktedonobacter racemifer DSM 44963 TaxID=485913 RepID=D6U807_KTERA|nr:PAS domain S-box protein [Ktedonobacter racemifer]EFH80018.1 PAS/PAC sensor signal transduction histidine kinase [Ktedonobacter racemifer DSM 44963]
MAFFNDNPQQENTTQRPPEEADFVDRFRAMMEGSTDIFCILTLRGEVREISPSWHNFTGQEENEYRGKGWLEAFHPADQPQVEEALIQTVISGRSSEHTRRVRRYDGSYRLIHWRLIPVRKPSGAIYELVAYGTDVTEQELAKQMSEAEMQLAVKASGVGLLDWNLLTLQFVCTDQMAVHLGLSPVTSGSEEQFLACVHPDDREKVKRAHQRALTEKRDYSIEYRTIWPDGSLHWLIARVQCISDLRGKPIHLIGVGLDVTELKQAEEALRESEARFRHFMDSNIIAMALVDLEGTVHEANDALLKLLGYTREDLTAGRMQWTTMTPPEYRAQDARAIEELQTTGVVQPFEKEYVAKDGTRVPVLNGGTLLRRVGSSPLAITFVLDLTARKEVERQKDLFLGITSHELKTPLTALRGTLQLIQRRLKRVVTTADNVSPEWSTFVQGLTKNLEDCARQVDAQTRLINDLLDISRITSNTLKLSPQRCELVSLVRETVEDLRVTAPERSLLLEMPENTLVHVLADRDRISQVVTNYVTNALRYSRPDQPVHIGLTAEKGVARVWVRDRGPGLSAEAQKEIWQRFHQVKGVPVQSGSGKGLGLGLYICQMLIAEHQGEVGVESTLGEGSTFWFTLPIVP